MNPTKEECDLFVTARQKHFEGYHKCQFKGCVSSHVSLKHTQGMEGDLLYDRKYFRSFCEKHFNQEIKL